MAAAMFFRIDLTCSFHETNVGKGKRSQAITTVLDPFYKVRVFLFCY